jgi:hypothetical protein
MNAIWVSLAAFLAIFGSALASVSVAQRLPEPHLSAETRTAVSVSMAVVGTLAALVLSLMITNASTSFKVRSDAVETLAIDIIKLDRLLGRYGSQADSTRAALRTYAKAKVAELAQATGGETTNLQTLRELEAIDDQIAALNPGTERERQIVMRASGLTQAISEARWLLVEKTGVAVPQPFLILLIFWLALLFASFGLFAPRNATVIIILLLCGLAISGGIFMILELGSPTRGLIRVPIDPLLTAIAEISSGG